MRKLTTLFLLALLAISTISTASAQGDTTWVQTYTWEEQNNPETAYDSPGRKWFEFPASDNGEEYRKVLMYHKLKCFSDGTAGGLGYACGEWDYLTYNYLFDHTGLLDSNALVHPHYKINNADFEVENIIYDPVGGAPRNTIQKEFSRLDNTFDGTETVAEQVDAFGNWSLFTPASVASRRVQMVYTADELVEMGVVAETPIREIRLGSQGFDSFVMTTLRYKFTNDTTISTPVLRGWNEVYNYVTDYSAEVDFGLNTPIVWDGESNIMFDLSLENAASVGCDVTTAPNKVIAMEAQGGYLNFDGADYMELLASSLETVENEVTLELWLRGDESIPFNTTVFEGVNANDHRELNVHVPWSNSRVYWDAGNDGGYDRIDELCDENNLKENWVHWAFVKNATTGNMSIVRNGQLWHTGSEKDNPIGQIVRMFLGSSAWSTNNFKGDVDCFRIWDAALSAETVSDWMYSSTVDGHPLETNLVANYSFNGANGTFEAESEGSPFGGYYHGDAGRISHKYSEIFQDHYIPGGEESWRPSFKFVQADSAETSLSIDVRNEYVKVPPVSVATYEVQGNSVNWIDIQYGWPANTIEATLNELGDTLSIVAIEGESVEYVNNQLEYFSEPFEVIDRYELGRYITPYGIGLSLDNDGWTWIYDVTDYLPLLRDSVELECGNWQELLDLKFAFIEGTAPRDVLNVDAFWNGTYYLSSWDENVVAHEYIPNNGEEMFKLITRASGHGFGEGNNCAEFCYNTHTASVNGTALGSWEIMQECADNPLYPQGGTWIYDRAAWCPGDKVAQQEFELTDYVSPDEPFDVEYDITYDPYGNYRMEGQVIAYGAPNMQVDVELMDILAPNDRKVLSRWNPVCENPKVLIRNNGEQLLNSCTFTFGIDGEELHTYVWTAETPLAFLETAEVSLPYDAPNYTIGDEDDLLTFKVTVEVADGFDEEPNNGVGYSTFRRPPTYAYNDLDDNRVIVWTKTNNSPFETSVELLNENEEVIWSRNYTQSGTTYKDTLALNAGCYRFNVLDSDDDGMDFWANNDGSGYVRLKKVAGSTFVSFEADFGKSISQAFRFETDLVNDVEEFEQVETVKATINAYPNPATSNVMVSFDDWSSDVVWELRNSMGMLVQEGVFSPNSGRVLKIDVEGVASGIYSLSVTGAGQKAMQWVMKK